MNTDFMVWDDLIREKQYEKNITSRGDTRYYDDSCKSIKKYAKEQNTVYDPMTNRILYGINSNMHVSGVSDGTCNQINPLLLTPRYMCGAGAAGGNRCVPDAYPQAYSIATPTPTTKTNPYTPIKLRENFESKENSNSVRNYDSCNITEFIIALLLIMLLIGIIYAKSNNYEL